MDDIPKNAREFFFYKTGLLQASGICECPSAWLLIGALHTCVTFP